MRKFWFTYLAKAIVFFPGGFGTMDELFEMLTLLQTRKIHKHMPIVMFGSQFWNDVVNLEALVRYGTIDRKDLDLIMITDSVDEAFEYLTRELTEHALNVPGATL
jgi:predicted Rossmann-fold nucleotide-binding protein